MKQIVLAISVFLISMIVAFWPKPKAVPIAGPPMPTQTQLCKAAHGVMIYGLDNILGADHAAFICVALRTTGADAEQNP